MEQFKEGDWIRSTETDEIGQVQFYAEESNYPNGCYYVNSYTTEIFNAKDCILWEPQKYELCWFWNEKDNIPRLETLEWIKDNSKGLNPLKYVVFNANCEEICCYKYCKPFIGVPPINKNGVIT